LLSIELKAVISVSVPLKPFNIVYDPSCPIFKAELLDINRRLYATITNNPSPNFNWELILNIFYCIMAPVLASISYIITSF
jgi:hypothetical protein